MKASDLFNEEEKKEVKEWLKYWHGAVVKVTDTDGKVLFDSGRSFRNKKG